MAAERDTDVDRNVQTSAQRVLAALRVVCMSDRPVSLAALAEELGVPQATAYRSAQTLISAGFIESVGDGRSGYAATWQIVELSSALLVRSELRSLAQPLLRGLADTHGESVTLAIPDGGGVLFVDRIRGDRHIEFYCDVGRKLPLHIGAAARAILAHYPAELFERYVGNALVRHTDATMTTPDQLRADRELIRNRGYAVSREDVEVGITGVAAPIFNARGEVLGAAAIANLTARWSDDDVHERGTAIAKACAAIGLQCGQLTHRLRLESAS